MSRRSAQQLQLLHIGPYGTPTARQRTIDRARYEHFCLTFQAPVLFKRRYWNGNLSSGLQSMSEGL